MRLAPSLEAFFWEKSRRARLWLRRGRASFYAWRQRLGDRLADRHEAKVDLTTGALPPLEPPLLGGEGPYLRLAPWPPADSPAVDGTQLQEQQLADDEFLVFAIACWQLDAQAPPLVELGLAPLEAGGSQGEPLLYPLPNRVVAIAQPTGNPSPAVQAAVFAWPTRATSERNPTAGADSEPLAKAEDPPRLHYPLLRQHGRFWLHPEAAGPLRALAATNLDARLAAWPPLSGPPTVLFLLPFLAVGGAERLLFDLLRAWQGRFRAVIVTVEPHAAQLGQTIDTARGLTPWVFPLGDWLPRECHYGALCHLVRRLAITTLCSWNGTIFFYDHVAELRHRFPGLRIAAQLYHHQGGFFARTGPEAIAAIDLHCAVNQNIARALREDLGVQQGIELIHHGVEIPELAAPELREAAKQRLRAELGLPADAVVVGTFARLHPQKRPWDVLALARRFAAGATNPPVYFLWVGGGPLEPELRDELGRKPLANFHWQALVPDARPFYQALDLCLLTSAYEGLPIFLLDGLARGLPCVATAVGEIPFLLSSGGGVLAEPGDLDSLEAGIRSLLEPRHRATEGERGRANVRQHFSLEVFARRYRQVLLPGAADV